MTVQRLEAFELKNQQRTVIGGVEVKMQAKSGKGAVTRVKCTGKRKRSCWICMRQITHNRAIAKALCKSASSNTTRLTS